MDIATMIGVIAGMVLIIGSILLGSGPAVFLHVPSMMITVGGTIAATLISFPLEKVKGVASVVKKALLFSLPQPEEIINKLLDYNKKVRREGLNALEESMDSMYPFLKDGVQMVLDGTEPKVIRNIMSTEMDTSQSRHGIGKKLLETMGAAAPAFGMIGTLIGLVQMLQNLSDPSQIGAGMATALLTTFYGAFLANLVFLPLALKLEARDFEESLLHELILEGILALQAGEHPFIMAERLKVFLASKKRAAIKA